MSRYSLAFLVGVAIVLATTTASDAGYTQTVPASAEIFAPTGHTANADDASGPKMYAILVGSEAPFNGVDDAIRGDLDVDRVATQISWSDTYITLKYRWDGANTVASDIQWAASTIAAKMKPGDSFMFYYSGHGTGGSGWGIQDFINPVQSGGYQDNSLTSVFSTDAYANVNKLFVIDSCHSEGIWKNDTDDDRDLQTLSKISFLGSSSEDGVAYADPNSNGTGFLTNAILPTLTQGATFGSVLASGLAVAGGQVTGYFKDEGDGFGSGPMTPVGGWSGDFDLSQPMGGQVVPEPASLVLLGCVASGFLVLRRRTR